MTKSQAVSFVIFIGICTVLFSGQQRRQVPPRPAVSNKTVNEVSDRASARANSAANSAANSTGAKARPLTTEAQVEEQVLPALPLLMLAADTIRFPATDDGRNHSIVLVGDPRKEGLYVTRTVFPKGKKILPHWHTDSRTVVVLQGTYYYGIGDEFDEKKMIILPAGSFYTEPAGEPHYTWAKEDEVIVQTTAIGPSGTKIVPDKAEKESTDKRKEEAAN
jgi:quercetin dioxygenase-like cupin family protein